MSDESAYVFLSKALDRASTPTPKSATVADLTQKNKGAIAPFLPSGQALLLTPNHRSDQQGIHLFAVLATLFLSGVAKPC